MSHLIGILLVLVSLAVTTCRALPDFHKHMSPQQLQSVFHVDTPDDVPHYEVVQLLHHNIQEPATQQHHSHYRRRKRSVEPLQQMLDHKQILDTKHVKKDLSKNPYYSEIKEKSASSWSTNSVYEPAKKEIKDIKKEHKVSFNAFGKDLNLTLKQTEGLFKNGQVHRLPMWYVDNEANATHGLNLQKIKDELNHSSDNIGQVFQDEENMAAILMRRHEVTGDLIMEGSIGHDMVIKPLPHDLIPNRKESHHVIFKRDADNSEHLSDFAFMEPDDLATSEKLEKLQSRRKRSAHRTTLEDIELEEEKLEHKDGLTDDDGFATHKRAKRQAPYIIYPEILVIVDYDGYRLHGGDNLQVKRYFISFWNGVDLRYRLLKGPRIRVSIAGIIISRGRDATPYLERNRVGRDAIDSAAALTDMGKYLFRERRLPVYDIAVAITKYDMCRRRKGGRCTKGTAGFAYVGGACVVNKRLEKVNSVAIIEDTGGFSGIIVAAHEVGHLLGAVHDGSPPPSYLGGPGAQRCRWEDGYIMSDLRHTERGFRWSPCTVQSFHHFLNGDTATCLHNAPHEDSALGRSLPGTLLSLDAQCRRDRGTYACFKDERVCAQLFCFDAQTGYCVAYRPAAEGSSCGNSLHCLDGRCAPLPSNVIPNYGHQYRLGYKSNESLNDDLENNSKDSNNSSNTKDDDNGDEDDEEEDDDDDDDEENSSEEDEEGGEEDEDNEEDENDSNNSDNQTSANDNDDDEQYLTENFNDLNKNHEPITNNNQIDLRNDNNVDETMLKTKNDHTNSLNSVTINKNYTQNTNLINLNTYQYLAQLWQNLQITTKKPLIGGPKPQYNLTNEQVLQQNKHAPGHVVVVKTSTKSSISSSSESTRNFNNKLTVNLPTTQQLHQTLHNTLDTTTTPTQTITPTTTSTLLKSLRKQFQYYLKLLQDNNSNNNINNKNSNSRNNGYLNNNKPNDNRQTILPSKFPSNSLQNGAASSANLNEDNEPQNPNQEEDQDNKDEDDAENNHNGDNGGEDNDESNETIEKLKRKLSLPFTTKTLQLQPQLQQQLPTTALPLTTTFLATATPRYGSKSTASSTGRTSSSTSHFYDSYFKKISNPKNSNQKSATTAADITRANEKKTKLQIREEKELQSDETEDNNEDKSVTTFEAQFLKRTPANPSKNEGLNDAYSSSSSLNTNNPYFIPKTNTKIPANRSSNNSNNNRQNNNNNESILLVTPPATRPQTSVYVTNFIGDNTQQRLTTVRQQQQKHQNQQQQDTTATTTSLQQYNSHQHASKTTTTTHQPTSRPPSPQSDSLYLFSSTTKRPKIKTQKLIRRLRTQIK